LRWINTRLVEAAYAVGFPPGVLLSHYHAVVWIDHSEAHVMHIRPDDIEKSIVHPATAHQHLHVRAGTLGSGRAPEDQDFYHRVAAALTGAQEILVVGPAHAKLQLIKHIHVHDAALAEKVIGVETVDHPTDGQLVAYARKYFQATDRMR
jgi:stalled ribosome rescue protein Dom34